MRLRNIQEYEYCVVFFDIVDIGKDYNKQSFLCMAVCIDITEEARYNLKP
jgi:hypothetical protein